MNITLENLTLANGRVLVEKTEQSGIYKVIKVAKNTNYEGLKIKIEEGSFVLMPQVFYNSVKIEGKQYNLVKPSEIYGIFE